MNAELIDHVARQMTAHAPAADLRARVLDRLADRRRAWTGFRLQLAAAGVVLVALSAAAGPVRDWMSLETPTVTVAASPAASAPGATGAAEIAGAASVTGHARRSVRRPSASEVAWLERAVPALAEVDALVMIDIGPAALVVRALDLKPLTTEPITSDDK